MRLTLAQRILAISAAALVPILLALAFNESALRRQRAAEIHDLALATAMQATLELERLTSGAEGLLQAVAAAPVVQAMEPEACSAYLAALEPRLPEYIRIVVLDPEGRPVCRSEAAPPSVRVEDRPYFQEAAAEPGRIVVGGYTESRVDGNRVLPLALGFQGDDGALLGVVATGLDLDWLGASLEERQLAPDGSLTIADRDGVIIARQPLAERFVGTLIPEDFRTLVRAEAPGSLEVLSQDGTPRILGYVPVGWTPLGLYVSAGMSRDVAFRPVNAATLRTLAVALPAVALAAFLSWLLGQRLVLGPVARIAGTLAARRGGDESARTGMDARDGEIEGLGAALDGYIGELAERRRERDRAEELLREALAGQERLTQQSELLAREMSHRIMNSFQLMESMFALQTRRVTDPAAIAVIREAEERLRAMSLVHRLLFRLTRDEMGELDAGPYLGNLVRELAAAFGPGEAVSIEVEAEPGLPLSPGQGIAMGLLVTELVLNALKHAFGDRPGGRIRIGLAAAGPGSCRLVVEDDGVGLPPPDARGESAGVGMRLLDGFLRQLDAEMRIEGPPGTRFVVTFPERPR